MINSLIMALRKRKEGKCRWNLMDYMFFSGQYDRLQTPVLRTAKSGAQAGDAPTLTPFQRLMQAHQLHKTPKPTPKSKPTPPAKAK
jgi:hypothetical protein